MTRPDGEGEGLRDQVDVDRGEECGLLRFTGVVLIKGFVRRPNSGRVDRAVREGAQVGKAARA